MPTLVGTELTKFTKMLAKCEAPTASRWLNDWEQGYVADMREKFDSREDALDLGCQPWNPTSNQWNTLKLIAEKV